MTKSDRNLAWCIGDSSSTNQIKINDDPGLTMTSVGGGGGGGGEGGNFQPDKTRVTEVLCWYKMSSVTRKPVFRPGPT